MESDAEEHAKRGNDSPDADDGPGRAYAELNMAVVNIVATFDLSSKIDLKTLVLKSRNVEYNPRKFQGAVMRLRDPKATAILFGTGKVVVLGLKSEAELKIVSKKVESIVQKIGFEDANVRDIEIRNLTVSGQASYKLRLEGILHEHHRFCVYEPELFPGLYYRMLSPKLCFVLFISGKIVVCGAKSMKDVYEGIEKLQPVLYHNKVRNRNDA